MNNQNAVDNFLASLDTRLTQEMQENNAYLDSFMYDWDQEVLDAILKGIRNIYKNSNSKKRKKATYVRK